MSKLMLHLLDMHELMICFHTICTETGRLLVELQVPVMMTPSARGVSEHFLQEIMHHVGQHIKTAFPLLSLTAAVSANTLPSVLNANGNSLSDDSIECVSNADGFDALVFFGSQLIPSKMHPTSRTRLFIWLFIVFLPHHVICHLSR